MRIRYLKQYRDRHGKMRLYVRIPGQREIRLPVSSTDNPGFGPAYAAALNGEQVKPPVPKSKAPVAKALQGSLRELCARYSEFLTQDTTLSERTKYVRRRHLEEVCREAASSGAVAGDMLVDKMAPAHVQQLLDRKRATPEASNDRRKAMMSMFKWAVPRGLAKENPVTQTASIKTHSEGFATWGQEHVTRFAETHPLGTKPYLAFALLLWTGQRRADVVRLGPARQGQCAPVRSAEERAEVA